MAYFHARDPNHWTKPWDDPHQLDELDMSWLSPFFSKKNTWPKKAGSLGRFTIEPWAKKSWDQKLLDIAWGEKDLNMQQILVVNIMYSEGGTIQVICPTPLPNFLPWQSEIERKFPVMDMA